MSQESDSAYERNVNRLAYFYSRGPCFTEEAVAKAREVMNRPLSAHGKRNLLAGRQRCVSSQAPEKGREPSR